jgi:hypothetical protein
VQARFGAAQGQHRVEDRSKDSKLIESPVALALVPGIPVELAFLQFFLQSLGGVE